MEKKDFSEIFRIIQSDYMANNEFKKHKNSKENYVNDLKTAYMLETHNGEKRLGNFKTHRAQ